MDQFKELWDEGHRGGLPLIINFVNNFYGMGGQPVGETMGFKILARMGAGLTPSQLHAERIDGFNPLAVIDAIRRKKEGNREQRRPRAFGYDHLPLQRPFPIGCESHREKSEVDAFAKSIPIEKLRCRLMRGMHGSTTFRRCGCEVTTLSEGLWIGDRPGCFARANLSGTQCLLDHVMFSNSESATNGSTQPEVLIPRHENVCVKQLAKRSRGGFDSDESGFPKQQCVSIRDALFEAIIDRFYNDASLIAYGEENRDWGGAFGVYRGLTVSLPYHRLFNSPISEGAIIGTAVGYALEGGRARSS